MAGFVLDVSEDSTYDEDYALTLQNMEILVDEIWTAQAAGEEKIAHLQKQDEERRSYVSHAPKTERQKHYKQILGRKYKGVTFYNAIDMEEQTVGDFIRRDKDNIIFVIKGSQPVLFTSSRQIIKDRMAIYDCDAEGTKYISLTNIGYHGSGAANYDAIKIATLKSNYQIFALKHSGHNTGKLVSHEITYFAEDVVGGAHCQEGSQLPYYQTFIPPF